MRDEMKYTKKKEATTSIATSLSLFLNWQRFALPYVPHTVPSTLAGLTAGFGMFPGVSLLHKPPIIYLFPRVNLKSQKQP